MILKDEIQEKDLRIFLIPYYSIIFLTYFSLPIYHRGMNSDILSIFDFF